MTTKKKARKFRWSCGAFFEVRLVKSDRTKMQYRQVSSVGKPYDIWKNVDLGRTIAFAYGAMIPAKSRAGQEIPNEYWTPRGSRMHSDMMMPRVQGWRRTTFEVLKYLGVVTR